MFSGGKDSLATLACAMKEYKEDIMLLHNETPLEHPLVKTYVDEIARKTGLLLVTTKPERTLDEVLAMNGRRSCTKYWKVRPTLHFIRRLARKEDVIMLFGVRKSESPFRATKYRDIRPDQLLPINEIYPSYPRLPRVHVRFPLIDRSEDEVFSIIKESGLPLNPLYNFASRVSCFPCLLWSREYARLVATRDPVTMERLTRIVEQCKGKKTRVCNMFTRLRPVQTLQSLTQK